MKRVHCIWIFAVLFFSSIICFSNENKKAFPSDFFESLVVPSFTTNPTAVGGVVTICNGQSITYTNTSTGVTASSVYLWTFNGGSVVTATTAGPHTITYPAAGNFTTTLTVDGVSSSINVVVTNAIVPTLTISNTGAGYGTSVQNGVTVFTRCGTNTFGNFNFVDPNLTSYPAGTTFNVVWGDGTPNGTIIGPHFYTSAGEFQLAYTVNYPGGCSLTTNFTVFIGNSPPTVTISGSGASSCNPNAYQFTIISSNNSQPGTVYTITINDGSAPIVFPNGLPTNPYIFNYLFPDTSCGNNSTINNSTYADSYSIQVVASNPCSPQGTFTSIGPIRVALETKPEFTQSSDVACVGSTVTFENTTDTGENVGDFGCNDNYGFYWEITPPTGYTIAAGSALGSSNGFTELSGFYDWTEWTAGTSPLDVVFNQPGTYTIKLISGNDCGMNELERTICITPEVIANFSMSPPVACAPEVVTLTNTSSVPICSNSNNYTWEVTQANPANCPSVLSPGWTFTSGNANSFEPVLSFTSPGLYTVQLTASLQNVVPGALCTDDIVTKTILIKDKPTTVLTEATICAGESITLSPVVNNCYATQAVDYFWNFGANPPTIISSTTAANPVLIFANAGTYNYTLTLSNECGSRVFSSSIIVNPRVEITASGPTATCLNSNIQLNGTLAGGATTGTWTASIPNGTFFPNANALSPTYSPPQDFTGAITFILTSDDPIGPCPAVSAIVNVEFNAQAIADAGDYAPLCENAVLTLSGTIGGAASTASWTSSGGGTFSDSSALNSTFTPPANFVGTITLTLTTDDPTGPCLAAVDTVIITVLPTPIIDSISNLEVCNNDEVGPIVFTGTDTTAYAWVNSNPAIGLAAAGSGAISFTAINLGTSPITATITVTPINSSLGANCSGISKSFTILVNPSAKVNPISDLFLCDGEVAPVITFSTTNTVGTTTYSWTNSNNTIGFGDSGTGSIPSFTANNPTNAPITSTIIVTPIYTNNGVTCDGLPITFYITVNPPAQVEAISNDVVCHTQQVTTTFSTLNTSGTTVYNWTNSNIAIGLAGTGTGNLSFTATNPSTSPISGTITVTPTYTANGISCVGNPIIFTITVNPSAQVNQPSNLIICASDNVPTIALTTSNTIGTTTYSWSNDTPSIGLAASGNGDIPFFTATNSTSGPITATVTVIPFYTDGTKSCSGPSKTFTIIVNPAADVIQPNDLTYCSGTVTSVINFSTSNTNGSTTYSWSSNNTAIGIAASGNGAIPTFTTLNTTSQPIVATISVVPSFTNDGVICTGITKTFTITVNPIPTMVQPTGIEVCSGETIPEIQFSTLNTVGVTSYSWNNSNAAIGLATSGIGSVPSFITQNATTSQITATITTTPTFTYNGEACIGQPTSFQIAVNASPNGTISGSTSICVNAVQPLLTFTGTSGTAPFTFTYNLNNGIPQTITTTSGNSITLAVPTTTLGTFIYELISIQDSNSVACTTTLSQTATVIVYPLPTISTQPLSTQSICEGGTISALSVAYSGGTGTATYQWFSNTSASNSGGTLLSGANQNTYIPAVFTASGTYYFYCVVSLSGNGCNSVTSQVAEVIVVSDPIVSAQPLASQSLCQGSAAADLVVTATGGVGSFTYQWFSAATATGTGTAILNATNANYTPDTTLVGSTFYYCEITQSGLGCSVTSAVSEVIIVPAPSITTQPVASSVCIGGSPTTMTVAYANGTGTASYQWFSNTSNSTTGGTAVGTNSNTFTPDASTVGTLYYYCVVTFSSGGCTSVTSATAEVVINQIPSINTINLFSCSGDSILYIPQDGNGNIVPASTQYTWGLPIINPVGAITGESAQTTQVNEFNQILINTTNQIATATYTLTPISGICTGQTFTIEVTVYPKPTIDFSSLNQIICNETSTNEVTLSTTNLGAITYQWTATIPAGITGAQTSGTSTIPAQILTNTTTVPLTISYSAYATLNFNGNQCTGPEALYTITVNPSIIVGLVTSNYNGYGVSFAGASNGSINLSVSGGSGNYTFVWTDANGIQFATSEDVSNLVAGSYQVIINDGYCSPVQLQFTITEPPEILFEPNPAAQINLDCFGDSNGSIGITVTQESVAPYTYQLVDENGIIVASISNTYDLNPVFTGLFSGTFTFTITDANGGTKSLLGLIVTQPDDIAIVPSTTPITCYGANNASITLDVSGGTGPYTGAWNNLATGLSQTNLSAGNYIITITDAKGCQKPITVPIPEAPVFMVSPIAKNISCHGANDGSIQLNLVGGAAPLTLTWSDGSTAGLTRNNLGPGTYTATISDGTPCYISRTFIIIDPQVLVLGSTVTNATNCTNANSGTIDVNVSGGVPPFNYLWSNGATTEDLTNIPAGNYSLVLTDANGCSRNQQFSVTRPSPITLNVATQSDFNCQTKTVVQNFTAQSSGGVQPIQFTWSSGTVSGNQNQLMSTNLDGTIILTATDAIGCTNNYTFDVNLPILGNIGFEFDSFAFQTYGSYSINDPIQFESTITGDYESVNWNFGDGQFSTDLNPIHSYSVPGPYVVTLSVKYPFGCVYQKVISIIVTEGYKLIVPNAFTPNTDGLNELFLPKQIGLTELKFNVFDTWGELIYSEQGDLLSGWNGTINGTEAENGNYFYTLSGKTFYGTIITSNGPFVLIK